MKIIDHWLEPGTHLPSPNFNARPPGTVISLIVIHSISLPPGEFGGDAINRLFTNRLDPGAHRSFEDLRDLLVSAHALIRRDGEIVQYVAFDQRAWHAGDSCYEGTADCNNYSIGIELEGCDRVPYTKAQYLQLTRLIRLLLANYPGLDRGRIAGHSEIAPGRKQDPGPTFSWKKLNALLDTEN